MLSKHADVYLDEEVNELDEGWWASVLADEDAYKPAAKESQNVPAPTTSNLGTVNWNRVQELFDHDEIVILQVYGCNRGGVLVQGEEMQGFVPVSHLIDIPTNLEEDERHCRLAAYVGRSLELKVIECEPSQERIVFSERAALAGKGRRKQLFRSLNVGEMVQGTVTNVTEFGVFVDLGGVEGLIHVSELSWGRVQKPSDILQVGQTIETMILQVSEEASRVALSLKRLYPNPWDKLVEIYSPGDIVDATITSVMRFGAFARLGEGIEGLIHVSSINLPLDCKSPEKYFQVGQQVRVRILHIDGGRRRLGLGLVDER
jgi:small subunit ribosomal protein S1